MDAEKAVTMKVEEWRMVQSILLREALRLEGQGNMEDVARVMDLLVPRVEEVVDSPLLVELRSLTRRTLGLPEVE